MKLTEKTISSETIFKGRIITVKKDIALLPDGNQASREYIEHPGGVCVVPVTDNNEILMVRQYRYPYGEIVLEIPAGKKDKGEEPFTTGVRELKEETGAVASEFIDLGQLYPSPGYCGEIIWMYGAKGLSFGDTNPDEDEFLEVERVPLRKAVEMIISGEIKDAKTQAAILKINYLIENKKF
ncbi:MAG: NUDIX hydrolase [Acutalibacteraceae bacterium]|nr:NUDIX hydrolase [Acutalibacteraceae bacterium]